VLIKLNDILLVDDNSTLLVVLSEIFKERGYIVRTASDGFETLAMIRDRVPDILISDLHMPRMSGFELLSVVRRRFPTIAVIAMSGAYSAGTVSPGIAADGFYAKGSASIFVLLDILQTIGDEALRRSRRAAAPIWISGLPIRQDDPSTVGVACPECLRVFTHALKDTAIASGEGRCPHCLGSIHLAIAKESSAMGATVIPLLATRRGNIASGTR
jgi:CheY-like chemotaxis protein